MNASVPTNTNSSKGEFPAQGLGQVSGKPNRLGWREAWRIAGKISFEVQFRAALELGHGAFDTTMEKRAKKARTNTEVNKIFTSIVFGLFAAFYAFMVKVVYFLPLPAGSSPATTITVLTAVFQGACFAFLMLWGLMQSTTYISSGAASIGLYLPLSYEDVDRLALLGYLRLFDAQLITVLASFPIAFFLATFSVVGALACLASTAITISLSLSLMLLLAHLFYARIQSLGGSKFRSALRVFFIVAWASSFAAISFSYQLLEAIIPLIQYLSTAATYMALLLPLIYPFTLGYLVAYASGTPGLSSLSLAPCLAASFLYGVLGLVGARRGTRILLSAGHEAIIPAAPTIVRPVTVSPSSLRLALIRKDLRITLRNPSQAVLLVTPIMSGLLILFNTFIIYDYPNQLSLFLYATISPTIMVFFSIFLLGVEAKGALFTATLPLRTHTALQSKALLASLASLVLPAALALALLFRPIPGSIPLLFLSLSQCATIYTASLITLTLFTRLVGGGKITGFEVGQHLAQMLAISIISLIFSLLPSALYSLAWQSSLMAGDPLALVDINALLALWIGIAANYLASRLLARLLCD